MKILLPLLLITALRFEATAQTEDDQKNLYTNFKQIKEAAKGDSKNFTTNARASAKPKEIKLNKPNDRKNLTAIATPNTKPKEISQKIAPVRQNPIAWEKVEEISDPKFSLSPSFENTFRAINDGTYNLQELLNESNSDSHKDWGVELETARQDFFRSHGLVSDLVSRKIREFFLDPQIAKSASEWRALSQNRLGSSKVVFKALTLVDMLVERKRNQWLDDLRHNDELASLVTNYSKGNGNLCNELREFLYWAPKMQVSNEVTEIAQNVLNVASKNVITNFEDVITWQKTQESEDQPVSIPRINIGPKVASTFVTISDGAYNLQRALSESQDKRHLVWAKNIKLAQEEQYGAFNNLSELVKRFSENHDIMLRVQVLSLCIDSQIVKTFSDCNNAFRSRNLVGQDFKDKELNEFASHFFGFRADPRYKIRSLLIQDIKARTQVAVKEMKSKPEFAAALYQYYMASNKLWNLLIDFVTGAEQINVSPTILEDTKNFMNRITPTTLDPDDLFTDQDLEARSGVVFQKPSASIR